MAATVLPPIVVEIHASSPGIQVGLVASNQMLDLARREADIAIRHVRPSQPELFARHIGDFRANYYAARAYLDRRGRPRSVQDLAEHAFVGTSDVGRMQTRPRWSGPGSYTRVQQADGTERTLAFLGEPGSDLVEGSVWGPNR